MHVAGFLDSGEAQAVGSDGCPQKSFTGWTNGDSTRHALPEGSALEERQLWNGFKQLGKGVFWFGVGAVGQGGEVWRNITNSCREFTNNPGVFSDSTAFANGQDCMYSVLFTSFHAAMYARGAYQTAITFGNVMTGLAGGGNGKPHVNGSVDWASIWSRADQDQKSQIRSQLQGKGYLHSLENGSPDVADSITFYLGHHENITGPYFRHVTNGSHGFIHSVVPDTNATQSHGNQRRQSADVFGWKSDDVAGLKFSYDRSSLHE
ncbi:hypothetical protein Tdes44962_MAKER01869 [Teratosphaeria destructans]|uniref:Uncharacterized protein n=1 Tax=Teratosphaeria destructans TaxID=418781 RepID=A0A9W7SWH1_9PEZI|nr:hypothetical protein Tdes44962_MAKER01869 [Teratosphaeria destructans]